MNGRTVIKQRHPVLKSLRSFWNGVSIAFALVLLYASVAHAPWLLATAIAFVALAVARWSGVRERSRSR
jgi:hypothetical protein